MCVYNLLTLWVCVCVSDARRDTLAGVLPEGTVGLLCHIRPGPLLPGCLRMPGHGGALCSDWSHRRLHR